MKNILVVAKFNQTEALRVAAGLTLLSDPVRVAVLGAYEDSPAVNEQREMLEFAEVPCDLLADAGAVREQLPAAILAAGIRALGAEVVLSPCAAPYDAILDAVETADSVVFWR